MPAAGRRVDQITFIHGDQLFALDQELLRAFGNEPDFREVGMEVSPDIVGRGGRALGGADDGDIGVVVADPDRNLLAALHDLLFEIYVGLVDLVVVAMAGIDGLDELHALYLGRRLGQRIAGGFAGRPHVEEQHGLAAHRLDAVLQPLGHLDQEVPGRHKGLLAFDGDLHLAGLHHPEDAVIGIELGGTLFARRHGNPFTGEVAAVEHGLGPARLARVRLQDIGQAVHQPVGTGVRRQLGGLGGPGYDVLGGGGRRGGQRLGLRT